MKVILRLISAMLAIGATALWTLPVFAATNQAADPGGGGVALTGSNTVTVTSAGLQLVKQVYDLSGNCLASRPADASCNSSATSVVVAANTQVYFLIFVKNATDTQLTNVRIQDDITDSVVNGTDYFTYAAGTLEYNNAAADTATAAQIWTAINTTPTGLTDAVDGDTGSVQDTNAGGGANRLTIGSVVAQTNAQMDVIAHKTYALRFRVTKN